MNLTDETLSAFLDSELTEAEMETVRDQLAADPALADRLAELASVDAELQAHYGSIDDRPMPESVTRMLEADHSRSPGPERENVIAFPWWRRLRGHTGKAVAAAIIAGVAMTQWLTLPSDGQRASPAVAKVLESQPSGEVYEVNGNTMLTPRLTFRNQAGEWCRQFRMDTEKSASEQIACRTDGGAWQQVAREDAELLPEADSYQTATGGKVLDQSLDQMMAESPLGPDEERTLLEQRWRQGVNNQ